MSSADPHQDLVDLQAAFAAEVGGASDDESLYALQVKYLGRKGLLTQQRARMGQIAPADRKAFGQAFNEAKTAIEQQLQARREALVQAARARRLAACEDLTMLPRRRPPGSLHPITHTRRRLEAVFRQMGYDVVDGPHVEHEKYNFDDLNFLAEHPARDMQDTFFVQGRADEGSGDDDADRVPLVLRTHTSPVQIRAMLTRPPPVRLIAPGTVFRRDDDATHSPMFHQIEGLCIDRGVGMADLKATLYRFVQGFFGADLHVRLRPSFFPFVEPGAEFDMQCPFCQEGPAAPGGDAPEGAAKEGPAAPQGDAPEGAAKEGPAAPGGDAPEGAAKEARGCNLCKDSGWIELGGSGMVHPAVLEAVGVDPEVYTGWAFGFGIDRMAMLMHGIPHLRMLFEGDVRFLEQFPC
ncbi:phenylalanine--tRNA ligase subunit alpha [Paraliomyxa miuraensis]|uniref:phenylalanine--tRNA ligase subunit alpha n=1 Tax=Paraliomyxa miuraensis TaxID=376150 RepID=UPI0022597837|nr:phenylalanine--tRNA ligase subunit alpha [Paraliomyxa miuraensis]MCX4244542.1 phenylalanine--tRNA ligase subunit alpha [Paraliomyxa miuraensis]